MKKIGIVTWFNYHNFGTALQVTALYNAIADLGYEPSVINYLPKRDPLFAKPYTLTRAKTLYIPRIKKKFQSYNHLTKSKEQTNKFNNFLGNMSFTKRIENDFTSVNEEFDAFVCGSDQIWSPTTFNSSYFFLDFVKDNNKKVSYAPSMGVSKVDDIHFKARVKPLVEAFSFLSVREQEGAEIINSICGRMPKVVLDPTLLHSKEQWDALTKPQNTDGKYILCYFLGQNKESWKHVNRLHKELDLPVKVIPIFKDDLTSPYECLTDVCPKEFIQLVKNASLVCTDSFHGTIFSILYGRDFYVYERFSSKDPSSRNSRIYNLLNKFKLGERLVVNPTSPIVKNDIDWGSVYAILDEERVDCLNYLKNALTSVTNTDTNLDRGV